MARMVIFSLCLGLFVFLLQLDRQACESRRHLARKMYWSRLWSQNSVLKKPDVAMDLNANTLFEDKEDEEGGSFEEIISLRIFLENAAFNGVMDSVIKTYFQENKNGGNILDKEMFIRNRLGDYYKQTAAKPIVSIRDVVLNAMVDSVANDYFKKNDNEKYDILKVKKPFREGLVGVCKLRPPIFMLTTARPSISLRDVALNGIMDSIINAYFKENKKEENVESDMLEEENSPRNGLIPLKHAWTGLSSEKNRAYAEVAVQDSLLNTQMKAHDVSNKIIKCSLETFYKSFWSNGAKFPLSTYLNEMWNDTDVTISEWEDSGDGFTMLRKVTYQHPTNSKLGPK
eukprot:4450530-Ditylum_brightwellii.AAC.1